MWNGTVIAVKDIMNGQSKKIILKPIYPKIKAEINFLLACIKKDNTNWRIIYD